MSRSAKKNAEYAAQVEANLSRMYQEYLDRLSEEMGRKIAKEDLDSPEKREQSNPAPTATRDREGKPSSPKRKNEVPPVDEDKFCFRFRDRN